MEWLGFTRDEIRSITLIASLVSIIGPLIVGFILDRVSVNKPASYGKWLRILLFICFIAAGIFFGLLLSINHQPVDSSPKATFSCNDQGGHLFVRRLNNEICNSLQGESGYLKLADCSYTCELPENFETLYHPDVMHNKDAYSKYEQATNSSEDEDYDVNKSLDEENLPQTDAPKQQTEASIVPTEAPIPPPHICHTIGSNTNCYVYLDSVTINLKIVEGAAVEGDLKNLFSDNWCKHPLGE